MRTRSLPILSIAFVLAAAVLPAPPALARGAAPPPAPATTAHVKAKTAPAPATPEPATAIDLTALDTTARVFFDKLAADEVCPCDCPKSFAGCIEPGSKCKPALLLGSFIVSSLERGMPGDAFAESIARELSNGFSAAPKPLDVVGYATKGPANAKLTIVEYADFECGHCKAASTVVDQLVEKYPDRIRVVFKHFPLSFHAMAKKAAAAAEAAGRQGKFWEMHHALFATQEFLDDDLIRGHAKAIGLDPVRFEKDWTDPAVVARVEASRKEAEGLGVNATPAFFVNGRPYALARSVEGFELRFAMEDARSTSSCQ